MIDIDKAFEGRWRIKSENRPEAWVKGVKALCRDFFEAAILLAQGDDHDDAIALDQSFEQWWNLYDKKRGKEKCMKKWAKLSAKEKRACIEATPAYVASTPDVNYRKDPYTYLNNHSWNDTIYYPNNVQQQRIEKLTDILTG